MKENKRQTSDLPVLTRKRPDAPTCDPNIIPPDDLTLLGELGMAVEKRLKRGRYGVVYEGHFTDTFSLDKLTTRQLHYLFVRSEQRGPSGDMRPGRKFAVKFCDIETRKAYHIEDVEQRLHQEINFVRRVSYESAVSVVRVFCIFATNPSRYFMLMELADDNLQCLINANCTSGQNGHLAVNHVLELFKCLISAVQSLHQQKLTYGMMRTSNILVFGKSPLLADGKVNSDGEIPFRIKIADFVRSLEMDAAGQSASVVEDAIEEDLDDLFYVHSELFTLARFDFAKYQAFKESLKIMTDINAARDSMAIFDKALELVNKFANELK